MTEYVTWRGAMWWLVGFSNGQSGEELENPAMLDEVYREDYERGVEAGKDA